jgi:hypothetical protein
MDETRWTLRVRAAGKDLNTIYVRQHRLQAGQPLHFDDKYEQTTAFEHFLGAIGADLVGGLQVIAGRRRLEMNDIEAVVSGKLNNPLTYLGVVGEEGHPGLEQVDVTVFVSSPEPEESVLHAWEEMLRRSPIVNTLKSVVKLDMDVKFVL